MAGTIATVEDQAALHLYSGRGKNRITCGGNVGTVLINGYERRHPCTTQRPRARRMLRKFCTRACLSKIGSSCSHTDGLRTGSAEIQWRNTQTHDPPEYTVPADWLVGQHYQHSTNQWRAVNLDGVYIWVFRNCSFRIFKFTATPEHLRTN